MQMRLLLLFVLLTTKICAQDIDSSFYCADCLVKYEVNLINPDMPQTGHFFIRSEKDTFSGGLENEWLFTYQFDVQKRKGKLEGIKKDSSGFVSGWFVLDSLQWIYFEQKENQQNPGTFYNQDYCCMIDARPDSVWLYDAFYSGLFYSTRTEWKHNRPNGTWYSFEQGYLKRFEIFVNGIPVGEHISPGDEGRFNDHYDYSGKHLGMTYLRGRTDSAAYDEVYTSDSILVHFKNDTADFFRKEALTKMTFFDRNGKVYARSSYSRPDYANDSIIIFFPDGSPKQICRSVDYYYELRTYSEKGELLSTNYYRKISQWNGDRIDMYGELRPK